MKPVYKIFSIIFMLSTIMLLFTVAREWNYQFDQAGYYTGAGGIVHQESVTERNQFLLLLSVILLFITVFIGYKNPSARYRSK